MQIRFKGVLGRLYRLQRIVLALKRGTGLLRHDRAVGPGKEDEAEVPEFPAIDGSPGGEADQGVVAPASRQLGKGSTLGRTDNWYVDRSQYLAGFEGGLKHARKEISGLDGAVSASAGHIDDCIGSNGASGEFGGRIGMAEAAANCASVADRRMADVRNRQLQQRRMLRHKCGSAEISVAGQCADTQSAIVFRYATEFRDLVDIHQHLRRGQAHVQDRHQALAAGHDPGVVAMLFKGGEYVAQRRRPHEIEGRRFHAEESEQDAITGFMVFPFFKLPKKVRNNGAFNAETIFSQRRWDVKMITRYSIATLRCSLL